MPLFNSITNRNADSPSIKHFEIRLDESNIALRGSELDAPSAILKGVLVLCLSEPLQIKGIRMRFTGEKRLAWYQSTSPNASYVKHEEEFTRHSWEFKRSTETLAAGNYEWPFDMIVPGSMPESLEGMTDTWIIYRMKATVERGMLQQNSIARKQVRIIRSLDPTALELAHSMSVENTWPNKLQYSLSTPMKAVIFGSNICVDLKLIPLLKGLKIGKIITELLEKRDMTIRGKNMAAKSRQIVRTVARDEYRIPDDLEAEEIEGQEGFLLSRQISVPQSLKECVQTLDTLGVKIRHNLTFNIQLHNPDGHMSELHATLPVYIFLSPNLPIGEDNHLLDSGGRAALTANGLSDLTPPQYGEHLLDQLYSDIDPSGYNTPAGTQSGINTPWQSRSRNVSSENLAAMNITPSSFAGVNVLHSRLGTLNVAGARDAYPAREQSQLPILEEDVTGQTIARSSVNDNIDEDLGSSLPSQASYFPARRNNVEGQTPTDVLSRHNSEEEEELPSETQTPTHVEYSAESLAKVPSYTTALRSNARTHINKGLPSYQSAIRGTSISPPDPCHLHQDMISSNGHS